MCVSRFVPDLALTVWRWLRTPLEDFWTLQQPALAACLVPESVAWRSTPRPTSGAQRALDSSVLGERSTPRQHAAAAKVEIRRARRKCVQEIEDLEARRQRLAATGVPNHIGARRFSEAELDAIAGILCRQNDISRNFASAPHAPLPDVREAVEGVSESFGPSCGAERIVPWWCRLICQHRQSWAGFALGEEGEGAANNIFLFMSAKEAPYEAMFLELRPVPVDAWYQGGDGEFFAPAHRTEYAFMGPLRFVSQHQLPIAEEAAIVVFTWLRFQGPLIGTNHPLLD